MQRVREAAAKAQQAESVSKPRRVRLTAADRERAREAPVHRNRAALLPQEALDDFDREGADSRIESIVSKSA